MITTAPYKSPSLGFEGTGVFRDGILLVACYGPQHEARAELEAKIRREENEL